MAESWPEFVTAPFRVLLEPSSRLHAGHVTAALLVSLLLLLGWGVSPRRQVRWCLRILGHRSFRTDALLFFCAASLASLAGPHFHDLSQIAALRFARFVLHLTGGSIRVPLAQASAPTLFAIVLFFVDDFTRYGLHRALHRFPFLWRFHRVHHSAVVMTPLTFKRQHPVEILLYSLRHAVCLAFVLGLFLAFRMGQVAPLQVAGISGIVLTVHHVVANLRHSHVRLGFGGFLETFLVSPAQHQIHHGREPEAQGCNFGSTLAVWDALFGTLTKSHQLRIVRFGLLRQQLAPSPLSPTTRAEKACRSPQSNFRKPLTAP